ncbi:MAG: hypothetical protein EPO26_09745 [Chloroflexota bacterium]|nr:MAG: hypothetical protein EPO26_09745 [Chloroflexota bacterium]
MAECRSIVLRSAGWVFGPDHLWALGARALWSLGVDGEPLVDVSPGSAVVHHPKPPVELATAWHAQANSMFLVVCGDGCPPLGYLKVLAPGHVILIPWADAVNVFRTLMDGMLTPESPQIALGGWFTQTS